MMYRALLLLGLLAFTPLGGGAQNPGLQHERACDGGDLVSCSVLGLIYQTGAGGPRDLERATQLYGEACARGVVAACRRLDFLQANDRETSSDDGLARVGYIADAYDGAPIGGAVVRVLGIRGSADRQYLSDAEGRVVLEPLPRGFYGLDVSSGGFARTEGTIPVPWDGDFLVLMEVVGDDVATSTGGIYGQINVQGTETGVSDVDVTVSGSARARGISNREGRFQLTDLPPGPIELRLERLGYEPRTIEVTIQPGRTLELYATMTVEPVDLAPIEVNVSSRYLQRSGFYRRARFVSGSRFTYREIEGMNAVTVADVVRRVGGVSVVSPEIGFGSEAVSNRRRGVDAGAGRCRLRPYYNGTPTVDFNLELVPPDEIEAMEIYQGASVPVEYLDDTNRSGPSCGVVLLWTRDPRRPF